MPCGDVGDASPRRIVAMGDTMSSAQTLDDARSPIHADHMAGAMFAF